MLQRVLTSFVSLAIFFAVVFLGKTVFNIAVIILIVGALWELYRSMKLNKVLTALGFVSAALLGVGIYLSAVQTAIIAVMALFLISSVFLHGKTSFKDVYSTAFATFYIVFFMSAIIWLNNGFGIFMTLPIFVCAWMTDVGAYFGGYFFGKHKLIPRVSPKKTVEGAIGGVISAVLSCLLYAFIIKTAFSVNTLGYVSFALLGVVSSVLSQFGDLIASAIKRDCNIKDFGTIFPGHGGILDRFDSVVFIAPVVYYYIYFVINYIA